MRDSSDKMSDSLRWQIICIFVRRILENFPLMDTAKC